MIARELFPVGALVVLLAICRSTSAVDIMIEKVSPPVAELDEFEKAIEQFVDRKLYGNRENAKEAEKYLEKKLAKQIRVVTERYALTPSQIEKLGISGNGDIHQYLWDCHTLKNSRPNLQNLQQFAAEARSFEKFYKEGLHGSGSMFERTLQSSLSDQQQAKGRAYKARMREKLRQQNLRLGNQTDLVAEESQIGVFVVYLNSVFTLDVKQKQGLSAFLKENVKAPRGRAHMLSQLAELPPQKRKEFKSFFPEDKARMVDAMLARFRKVAP